MTFNEYQEQAISTDVFGGQPQPIDSHAFLSKLLGLVGEAGETAEKFKKIFRDKNGQITDDDLQEISKELGDVLWYLSVISSYLGLNLEEVAQLNLQKLLVRKEQDKLRGNGDNR